MIRRNILSVATALAGSVLAAFAVVVPVRVQAQDVPGIEICTVEKTMERRTSCLQSNINFLQTTIGKLSIDHQQKLDAANRQIEALKASLAGMQKTVDDLQAAQKAKGAVPANPAAKDVPARDGSSNTTKEGTK
jgi:uncharacterized protein HemX